MCFPFKFRFGGGAAARRPSLWVRACLPGALLICGCPSQAECTGGEMSLVVLCVLPVR